MFPCLRNFRLNRLPSSVPRCRPLATVPSSGPDLQLVGQCSAEMDEDNVPARFPLASTIRLANASVDELRQEFLHFFHSNQHTIVSPATVFPKLDEGSYFVNAGMNQFKPLFLGQTDSSTSTQFSRLRRATNCQPCIRVGGRHDDLNDVGYDRQHHTMFEMLGSWSFGDYYKAEACRYMWTFVTKVLGLPPNALYVTYFGGCPRLGLPPDDETRNIWLNLGVLDQKLLPFGMEHNFWRAGQSSGAGLCGPATELHVDFNALSDQDGLRCARCLINSPSPQVVELWNTVFITHRLRVTDGDTIGPDSFEPLSKQFVDTGMGLERLACVMQGVTSTYDSDVFAPLMAFIQFKASTSSWTAPSYTGEFLPFCRQPIRDPAETESTSNQSTTVQNLSKLLREVFIRNLAWRPACPTRQCMDSYPDRATHPTASESKNKQHIELLERWHRDTAYRLLADHSRALAHSLSDGLLPGRQGLALKLRQLIHRATRAAILTGLDHENAPVALLASLVAEVARRNGLASMSNIPTLQGPSARQPSSLSPEAMESVINQEIRSFLPRLHDTETSFQRCLAEHPETTRLSADQVRDLLLGKYGLPVSWDMICAQSHWAGLCVPNPVPMHPASTEGPHTSRTQPKTISRQLHNASIPTTNDSAKYKYLRSSDSPCSSPTYVIPVCRTRVVGLLLPTQDNHGDHILVTPEGQNINCNLQLSQNSHLSPFGVICECTNFFAPDGGQDCDTGTLHIGNHTFSVESVERITTSNQNGGVGWIVHWCRPVDTAEVAPKSLLATPEADLFVDQKRRTQLMCNHTGQHLFVWALDTHTRRLFGAQQTAGIQLHGGSVHADRFTVNAAILAPLQLQDDLVKLVHEVETLCLSVINQDLPVSAVKLHWNKVDKNPRVRRFPWVDYPSEVIAVCVGDTRVLDNSDHGISGDASAQGPTAELCCGTHLHQTGDIFDLVVTSVRARKQAVKEFTAIVGAAARKARLLGESLVTEALDRESSLDVSNMNERIEWLTTVLSQTNPTNPNARPLPLVAREKLQACLHRMRKARVLPSVETDQNLDTIVAGLSSLVADSQNAVILASVEFDKVDVAVQALLSVEPTKPVVLYCGNLAVYYCPHASPHSDGAALNRAHVIARELAHQQPHSKWKVKARPLRSNALSESNRFKFALWQLTSTSPQDSDSMQQFWNHCGLETLVATLTSNPTDRRNVSSGV
ncbi:alanyl-tRNA synthetase [Clonorchis sinensis]|uniref:alanine--tRNA ligase n=1 Tax=Clonorchis sinensis TaxID=79923 RepID=G7YHC7_CLOSI|nr:alanyl-tRNA synthetase [Clonorchis sinensis]